MSGLSIRTIQRIERGQTPGLESVKSLAAVFDVHVESLPMENDMTQDDQIDKTEQQAMEYVRDIKGFYSHAIKYVVVISLLFVINLATDASYIWAWWPMLGWGIGLLSHGLNVKCLICFRHRGNDGRSRSAWAGSYKANRRPLSWSVSHDEDRFGVTTR